MKFSEFSASLVSIEATPLRNKMTEELAVVFKKLDANEIEPASWLLLGRVYPQYEGVEFQFAEKMMVRAVALTYDESIENVTRMYKNSGDLGVTAQELAKGKTSTKTVSEIFADLRQLTSEVGSGSQERKVSLVVNLLKSLDSLSVRYVVRIILGKLRLGFSDMTILDALSWAIKGDKSDRPILEEAYQNKHDIGKLASTYLLHKSEGLTHFEIELGIPIQPALCQRLKTADEMIAKMGKVICESKYDGTRVQIHVQKSGDWRMRTFTRSLEESSAMFPELIEAVDAFDDHDLILDCEAVGYDPQSGKLLPFQETIQRKRKHDIAEMSKKVPLRFFVFDLLYLDGKRLLNVPLSERKEQLHNLFTKIKSHHLGKYFIESAFVVTESPKELREFHKEQLNAGLEGAVIKQYSSSYQPGRKGWSWVKFKEEETSEGKLSDTIDAVVMGYWYGKGKRTGFGIGAFLIGVMGKDDKILTLTKVGTGLSDEQWRELKERCSKVVSAEKPSVYEVDKLLVPDVWVDPQIVVEVAGDELTKSPNHSAGLALRFPRLVKFRDDKSVAQITTQAELASIK
jgi:DNA ligase-1